MSLFKGAGVALITPFNEDNSVNYGMLRTLALMQLSCVARQVSLPQ